ncbi:MAG: transporter [Glaciihabitans sp.]|nr:transporter [Glaciihabitans sp.]
MSVLVNSVYRDGQLEQASRTLAETYERVRNAPAGADTMACVVLLTPTAEELHSLAEEYDLHPLAIEDALRGHQRAKLERYDSTLFLVLRTAHYRDAEEIVEFGEVHCFVGSNFFVAAVHVDIDSTPMVSAISRTLVKTPELLRMGPQGLLYALLDSIVDGYTPVVDGLEQDIDQIEHQLFAGEAGTSRRIYELFNEVVAFQQSTKPLVEIIDSLVRGAEKYNLELELLRRFRDVKDHVIRVVNRSDAFRAALQNALTLDATIVGRKQNDDTKKISAWAAILVAPTLIAAIYGMNFAYMPELQWRYGYPLAVVAMILAAALLWVMFKVKRWL